MAISDNYDVATAAQASLGTSADYAAISYKTYLYIRHYSSGTSGDTVDSRLCEIKTVPAQNAPEGVQATTLSDPRHTYVPGLADDGTMTFTTNYSAAAYQTIDGMTGNYRFGISCGTASEDGLWSFNARIKVTRNEWTVGAVREMTLTLYPTTAVEFSIPSSGGNG